MVQPSEPARAETGPPASLNPANLNDAAMVAKGDHRDPFGWLGLHSVPGKGSVIRTFQPNAKHVWVVDQETGKAHSLNRIHPDGVYVGEVAKPPFPYHLRVEWDTGATQDLEDAYRFAPILGELDIHLLAEGTHLRTYEKMGAHPRRVDGIDGVEFAVWAPNARRVSVVGTFNNWDGRRHPMRLRHEAGIWEIFIPGLKEGDLYKYEIKAANGVILPHKADPYGFFAEVPPRTASIVHDRRDDYAWKDADWMVRRAALQSRDAPISIYEVHLGSWRRLPEEGNRPLTYLELADELGAYCHEMGFTHVEFLPVHEHPFSGSWGYQPIGLFAPTSRYGSPEHFRIMVEALHRQGIGVIIDWVAGHFPADDHGLRYFDGTALYEHEDPRLGLHRDWNTMIYNFGRNEVVNYLSANALFWLEEYHVDALRVDAVASMLYLDYSREPGEWIANKYGGNENLEAISFLRRTNELVYGEAPGSVTIAEESTAWPMVSKPVHVGGLGFGYKWNMGWMHDTLRYMSKEPIHRRYHHDDLTFGLLYAFQENFVLPLSHDEVVHGKGSILGRMPGDQWQRFANLRLYYTFMWMHPGKKLLFMGQEFGQDREWNHNDSLDWHLLQDSHHSGVKTLVKDLNRLYRAEPALHQLDCEAAGFAWIDCNDRDNSVLSFLRKGEDPDDYAVVVCNFTPIVRQDYRIGVPGPGFHAEILNSDSTFYGGSDVHNAGGVEAEKVEWHGLPYSLRLTLPPLAGLVLKPGQG